jgi:hypothetical protein
MEALKSLKMKFTKIFLEVKERKPFSTFHIASTSKANLG